MPDNNTNVHILFTLSLSCSITFPLYQEKLSLPLNNCVFTLSVYSECIYYKHVQYYFILLDLYILNVFIYTCTVFYFI